MLRRGLQTEPTAMESAGVRLLWKDDKGVLKARVEAGPQNYVLGEHPRHLLPYGTIITILHVSRKIGEEHSRANQKEWEMESFAVISTQLRDGW